MGQPNLQGLPSTLTPDLTVCQDLMTNSRPWHPALSTFIGKSMRVMGKDVWDFIRLQILSIPISDVLARNSIPLFGSYPFPIYPYLCRPTHKKSQSSPRKSRRRTPIEVICLRNLFNGDAAKESACRVSLTNSTKNSKIKPLSTKLPRTG